MENIFNYTISKNSKVLIHKNIQGIFFENLFIQDLLHFLVKIFCIWLYKANYITSIVAEVSDVAHGPLVLFLDGQNLLIERKGQKNVKRESNFEQLDVFI